MTTTPRVPVAGDRAFVRMAVVVGIVSTLVFTWFLTLGRADLVQYRGFGEVFDVQTRAFLDGHLAVPAGSLGFEGFVVDGRTYAYFGIFPSLLRLPLFLVTDRFDGRLSGVSMLAAYVIALWSAVSLVRRVRALVRPAAAWTRTGLVVAGALLVVVGIGSNLLFLAGGAWVYHEASLWGVAGVLASFAATLRFLDRPRLRTVVVAGLWAAVAWTSRGSVGLAPSIVLGLLGLARLTGHPWLAALAPPPERAPDATGSVVVSTSARSGHRSSPQRGSASDEVAAADAGAPIPAPVASGTWRRDTRLGLALLGASVAGALAFASVNTAKFGGPTTLPMDKQVASAHPWPERKAALDAYDGSLFSVRLVPSVLYQSLRPDLLEPTSVWPFVRFSGRRPPVWGNLVFDTVEPSAGLTVTSPLLLALAAVGVVAALRRRAGTARATVLRPFLLGGLAATYAPLTIAFIAQRYLTDALPLLLVGAAGGLAVIDGWAAGPRRSGRGWARPLVAGGAVALTVFGVVTTLAVTWSFQRFVIPPDPAAEAAALRAQVAVSRHVGDAPVFERRDGALPERAARSGLVVLGDCEGLYRGQSDGGWVALEVAASGGRHLLRVHLDDDAGVDASGEDRPAAILSVGDADDHAVVAVVGPAGHTRLVVVRDGVVGRPGREVDLQGARDLDVRADPAFAWMRVLVDGREALFDPGAPPPDRQAVLGQDPYGTVPPVEGTVTARPTPTPTCRALLDAHG